MQDMAVSGDHATIRFSIVGQASSASPSLSVQALQIYRLKKGNRGNPPRISEAWGIPVGGDGWPDALEQRFSEEKGMALRADGSGAGNGGARL